MSDWRCIDVEETFNKQNFFIKQIENLETSEDLIRRHISRKNCVEKEKVESPASIVNISNGSTEIEQTSNKQEKVETLVKPCKVSK